MSRGGTLGKVITFYSFKGGVGRTMALANVAFLAAMNGYRVLLMDWDLEAPGLAYYFRGQLDAAQTRRIKEAPGILDLVWQWTSELGSATPSKLVARFEEGKPFEDCVRTLLSDSLLSGRARLDYIGPGSRIISAPQAKPYEEALAEFSWTNFLNTEGGGIVLHSLRSWAKKNYDFVLVDSRTGLADVAGICTMQLPDEAVLCFVLNRQNMDGVARVAGAIRQVRNEQIKLRVAPMRVSRLGTSEQADAYARALYELTRTGGFSAEALREDFQSLAVLGSEGVPFYETLAPFSAQTSAKLDSLTLNYASMGQSLLGVPLDIPEIPQDLIEQVRRRLQPRHATLEYVTKLRAMQPERAIQELQDFLESAFDAILSGELVDDEYVAALVEASISFLELANTIEGYALQTRTLDLLRELSSRAPARWRPLLVGTIERLYDAFGSIMDDDEQMLLLEEIDSLLADDGTLAATIKRIEYRRRVAALHRQRDNYEATMQTVGEIRGLIANLRKESALPRDQAEKVLFADLDAELLGAESSLARSRSEDALKIYINAARRLRDIADADGSEVPAFLFRINLALATKFPDNFEASVAADYALKAAQTARTSVLFNFQELARVVLESGSPSKCADFLHATLGGSEFRRQRVFSSYFGRTAKSSLNFIQTVSMLFKACAGMEEHRQQLHEEVAETVATLLATVERRRHTLNESAFSILHNEARALAEALELDGVPEEVIAPLLRRLHISPYARQARPRT